MIKICLFCNKEFKCMDRKRKFCSRKCADTSRRGKSLYTNCYKICKFCGNKFKVNNKHDFETRRFCCTSHASQWRSLYNHNSYLNNMPKETRELNSKKLKELWKNNEFRNKVKQRMIDDNPVYQDGVIDKANETKRQKNLIGFTGDQKDNRGGNGKLSPVESLIFEFMKNLGFQYNLAISMTELRKKEPSKKFAYSYKADFTHKDKKICIEIDGYQHKTTKGKILDSKKQYALNYYGYTVYHFDNSYIENNLLDFKNRIINILGYKIDRIKSINQLNNIDILYDLEIQNNHNFFADNILVHNCKSISSSQAEALLRLNPDACKVGMTGTLLVNNPYDLFCPMSFIGLINYNKWLFERKFVIKDDWGQIQGYQNMDELHEILYKSSIRRTKDLLDLPEKMYKQEWIEFSKEEQDVFAQIIGTKPFNLEKIDEPLETVAIITRMRQATVAGNLLTDKCKVSSKFDRLNDILEEAKLNNQKVLVFCPFTQALELGLEYCKEYKPKLIKGGMGTKVQEVVDEHEQSEGFSVIFAQEATLGVGFTLTNTSIVVFLSPPWNRATYDQCIDRTHRIGQKRTVQIIDLLIKDTYDELIYKKLHGKGALADRLIDGKEDEVVKNYLKEAGINYHKKELDKEPERNIFTLLDGFEII